MSYPWQTFCFLKEVPSKKFEKNNMIIINSFTVYVYGFSDAVYIFRVSGVQSGSCNTNRNSVYCVDIYIHHRQRVYGK